MVKSNFSTDDKIEDAIWRAPFFTLTVLLAAPILVHECYSCYWGFSTLWDAADMLQYVGVAASGFGTIALGYFTVLINRKMQKHTKEMMKIAERSLTREERNEVPLIDFTTLTDQNGSNYLKAEFLLVDSMYRIRFWMKNDAAYGIKNIKIIEAVLAPVKQNSENHVIAMDAQYSIRFLKDNSNQLKVSILPRQEAIVCLFFPYVKFPAQTTWFYVHVVFENENNNGTLLREAVNISFHRNYMEDFLNDKEWPLRLFSKEVQYEWVD